MEETVFDRFARFYDLDYREYEDDLPLVMALAQDVDGPLLELGCGTGRVLAPLAAAGYRVTGIDVSPALLDVARQKLTHGGYMANTTLVEADMRDFDLPRKDYGFAFCMSNTFMHCASQDEQMNVLQAAYDHLRPGGLLLIDLFNPDIARLIQVDGLTELADTWMDPQTAAQCTKWSVRSLNLAEQLQETLFIYEEIFPDGRVQKTLCPFTLRFLWQGEGALMLEMAGFELLEVWGDFEQNLYVDGCERLIFLAQKPVDET
ncbi:MAG: class I SAM-dependent methyltransferase [Caldilineaceae bacterium]